MTSSTNDFTERGVRVFLPWLVEMGADEIVLERPVNRLADQGSHETSDTPLAEPRRDPAPNAATPALLGQDLPALAVSLATAAASLEALAAAWRSFDAHPLKRTATSQCFLEGAANARLLVLGDKPRSEEDPTGEVLSGSHRLLAENMLAAIGFTLAAGRDKLEQVALANFIPWRPPGNRAVIEMEAKLSVPFAIQLLRLLRPSAILCLGPLPGQYLSNSDPAIARARGKWREIEIDGHRIPMLTTFHPETLLKSPQSKKLAWLDLQALRERLNQS